MIHYFDICMLMTCDANCIGERIYVVKFWHPADRRHNKFPLANFKWIVMLWWMVRVLLSKLIMKNRDLRFCCIPVLRSEVATRKCYSIEMVQFTEYIHHWCSVRSIYIIGTVYGVYTSLVQCTEYIHHWYSLQSIYIIGTVYGVYTSSVQFTEYIHHWYSLRSIYIIGTVYGVYTSLVQFTEYYIIALLERGYISQYSTRWFSSKSQ
jgi:hypothetical protein